MRLSQPWRPSTVALLSVATLSLLTAVEAASTTNDFPVLSATTTAASTAKASGSSSSGFPVLSSTSAFPTLTGTSASSSLTAIPTVGVPPTANAPYMQRSNLPEGTFFICVGAALGFIALVMVVWRVVVTWMINRSVKKAAMTQYAHESKGLLHSRRKSGFYSQTADSTLSIEKLSKHGRQASTSLPKVQPTNSSLFFSPTAGAGLPNIGARNNSGYLPAGYYSVGNAAAGNAMPMTQLSGTTRHPLASSYSPVSGPYEDSPSTSPDLQPSRMHGMDSTTSLNTPGSRAPSAYLDDLVSLPPLPPPANGQRRNSSGPHGR